MKKLCFCGVVLLSSLGFLQADTLNILASKDTMIANFPSNNISFGGAVTLGAGRFPILNLVRTRRSLLHFDLSVLPTNAVITNVTLELYFTATQLIPWNVSLHRMIKTWNEGTNQGTATAVGDATWINQFYDPVNPTPWTTVGGDFNPTPTITQAIGTNAGTVTWNSVVLLTDVQLWKSTPATNFGWIVLGDESAGVTNSVKSFRSRDSANPPTLIVDYTLNNSSNLTNNILALKFEKLVPKEGKKISFKVAKGFKAKGKLFTINGSAATNAFTGEIYVFLKVGTNVQTSPVKLTKKEKLPKGQVKKGLLAQFKTDKTSGLIAKGVNSINKGTSVQVVFFVSNNAGVLYKTNTLTAGNIK